MKSTTVILLICIGALCTSLGCRSSTPNSVEDSHVSSVPQKTELKLVVLEQGKLFGKRPELKVGAYFIKVDDDEVQFFRQHLKDNIPRFDVIGTKDEEFPNMRQDEHGVVMDTKTGKQAEVFEFDKIEIKGNEATVEMTEAYSSIAILLHTYALTLELGKWVIHSHTTRAIS